MFSETLREGILSGEQATREVAAYLIDTTRFHLVPPTTYVQFYNPRWTHTDPTEIPLIKQKSSVSPWKGKNP